MRHYRVLCGVFLLLGFLCLPTASEAVDFNLFGGIWEDTDSGTDKLGIGARLAFFETLQVEVSGSYYSDFDSALRIRQIDGRVQVRSEELEVVPLELGLRYNFGQGHTGFSLGAGAGWYLVDLDGRSGFGDEIGLYGSAGWQYEHLFLEAVYREVDGTFGDELGQNPPRGANVDLSGFGLQVGWRF